MCSDSRASNARDHCDAGHVVHEGLPAHAQYSRRTAAMRSEKRNPIADAPI
jgi:hypothetical protein